MFGNSLAYILKVVNGTDYGQLNIQIFKTLHTLTIYSELFFV